MSNLKEFNQTIKSPDTMKYLESVLNEKKDSFVSNVVALVSSNTNLQKCDPYSIMFAAMKATALSLPLDPALGMAYVIPYGDKATLQLGYKSFVQLSLRSGQFKIVNVTDVKEGEIKARNMLSGEMEFQMLADEERISAKTVGYAAFFRLANGFEKTLYMTVPELEEHGKKYSKAYDKMWCSNFDAMARKTVIKMLLSKFAPLSTEMQEAARSDSAAFDKDLNPIYIDNPAVDIEGSDKAASMFEKAMMDAMSDAEVVTDVVAPKEEVKSDKKATGKSLNL